MLNTYASGIAALKFPSHYVSVEAEEMEYIDGGSEGTYRKLAGAALKRQLDALTPAERKALYKKVEGMMVVGAGSLVVGVASGGWAAVASVLFYGLGAYYA